MAEEYGERGVFDCIQVRDDTEDVPVEWSHDCVSLTWMVDSKSSLGGLCTQRSRARAGSEGDVVVDRPGLAGIVVG